ncbi:Cytochrome P450 2D6 [Folsomia candida]|uniref:Cytochrome P450 2D6 n=1 Tax=Folsomia candida TaxID=158441 RepID=A0A226F0C1_FOLCA|nr:Cytochrome P450 2D6 [Folsomia candida]
MKMISDDQFIITVMDLIQAGSDTTSGNMAFGILLLTSYPTVQEKFVQEIIKVVGSQGVPCLDDRDKMPYAQAVIAETLRYARNIMIMPRNVLKDFWYQGFRIKKGTALMMFAQTISMDEDVWGDPDNFRPERFIKNGSFNKEFADENTVPFGTGKRSCIGEGVARDALFIMLTTLIRNLKFSLQEGRPKPSLMPVLGLNALAAPFDVVVTPRK